MKKLMIRGETVWREAIERKSDRGEERERWRFRGARKREKYGSNDWGIGRVFWRENWNKIKI